MTFQDFYDGRPLQCRILQISGLLIPKYCVGKSVFPIETAAMFSARAIWQICGEPVTFVSESRLQGVLLHVVSSLLYGLL
jgi:hypothetical protein